MPKIRLDQKLVNEGLASTHIKAQALILAGEVLVKGHPSPKPGMQVSEDASVKLKTTHTKYVSRGGEKLEGALRHFKIDVSGKTCLDVGASTGGFTDCLLQQGAQKVFTIDVG